MSTYFAKINERLKSGGSGNSGGSSDSGSAGDNTTAAALASDRARPEREVSVALYLAAAVVQIAGLSAVSYQVGESGFAYFTMSLTILGLAFSYYMRRVGVSGRFIKTGAVLLGLVFLYALRGTGMFSTVIPFESRGTQELLLVSALAFTATFCSFLLLTDEAVVFTCVWAIAMIGLTGTVNINRELIMCFIVFLGGAVFLLIHQNYLLNRADTEAASESSAAAADAASGNSLASSRGGAAAAAAVMRSRAAVVRDEEARARAQIALLRTQVAMALFCGFAAIVAGFLIAIPMQMVGRNVSLSTIIQRLNVPAAANQRRMPFAPRLAFDNPQEFSVGLGPVADDPSEQLVVWGEKPFYWRGRTFEIYTGRQWTNFEALSTRTVLRRDERANALGRGVNEFHVPELTFPRRKGKMYRHRFRILSGMFRPMFHAAEPRILRAPASEIFLRPDNTLTATQNDGYDYEVESEILEPTPEELRRTGYDYPRDIRQRYLSQSLDNERLQQIAQEVTGGMQNPYDRAEALRKFIAETCTYTLDARAVPRGRDAAEFFLDESKEGYCDLYATALTILCRHAGLPARLVTGFAPGTPSPENPKRFILRGSNRHAWTEVYFNDYGWIPFDATVDTSGEFPLPQEPQRKSELPWHVRLWRDAKGPITLAGLGLLALLFVGVNELMARLSGHRHPRNRREPGLNPAVYADRVTRIYLKAVHYIGAKTKVRRSASATPGEYLNLVREQVGPATAEALAPLTHLAEQAFYGPQTVTDADVGSAHTAADRIRPALREDRKAAAERSSGNNAPVVASE